MTTPDERARSLQWCGELLVTLRDGTVCAPADRAAAAVALLDYPAPAEIRRWVQTGAQEIPDEAVRALLQAGDLLRRLRLIENFDRESLLCIQYVLRHYPEAGQIQAWSRRLRNVPISHWLAVDAANWNQSPQAIASVVDIACARVGNSPTDQARRLAGAAAMLHYAHADGRLLEHIAEHATHWEILRALSMSKDLVAKVRRGVLGSVVLSPQLLIAVSHLKRDH